MKGMTQNTLPAAMSPANVIINHKVRESKAYTE